jgi:hypothetical protein
VQLGLLGRREGDQIGLDLGIDKHLADKMPGQSLGMVDYVKASVDIVAMRCS